MIWTNNKIAELISDESFYVEKNSDFTILFTLNNDSSRFSLDKKKILKIHYVKGLNTMGWDDTVEEDDSIGVIKNKIIRLEKKLYIYLNNLIIEKENEISRLKMARLELTEA